MSNPTTQSFIPVKEIRDGVIVREDGVFCGIITVTAINFSLKSTDEQDAILYQFENVLNSLEVGVQIIIQSRKLNIKPYIEFLKGVYEKQKNELMRYQTQEYMNFITELAEERDIMTKNFYVIVLYSPIAIGKKGGFSFFGGKKETAGKTGFEENRVQLIQRIQFIENNLRSLGGVKCVMLDTEAVTELIYQTFNPGDTQSPTGIL